MFTNMPLKYPLLLGLLLCCVQAQAYEKVSTPQLDLIELLGELDDEDQASLEAATTEVETKTTSKSHSKPAKNDASIGGKQ